MYSLKSVLEDETHTLLWDFEIQSGHLIQARRPDQEIAKKKQKNTQKEKKKQICRIMDFAIPADHRLILIIIIIIMMSHHQHRSS